MSRSNNKYTYTFQIATIIFDIRINYFVCIIVIDLGCSKKRAPGLWMHRKTPPPPGYKLLNCKIKNETKNLLNCF